MSLPVDVRIAHTNDVATLTVGAKDLLNQLLAAAKSDTLTRGDRYIINADLPGLWDQVVDIANINRAAMHGMEDADGKETPAAISAA